MIFNGGLYLHVPFCRQACHYCNFHFTTSLAHKESLIDALKREIAIRASLFDQAALQTIYFGGGSPSLLGAHELASILETIHRHFDTSRVREITLEANPDDLSASYLQALKSIGIQRLSIGIQSFHEEDLRWMNRAHNAEQALNCIPQAQDAGFEDLSADLIFGYPLLTDEKYVYNLATLAQWNVPHISAYSLTVEEKTPLEKNIRKGLDRYPDNDAAASHFIQTSSYLTSLGYEHYEISNYALPGCHAIHNSNYWLGVEYLGAGPSAHSYYGGRRYWNVANNQKYVRGISSGIEISESETIDPVTAYNELILTRLRTKWGVQLSDIEKIDPHYVIHFLNEIRPMIDQGFVEENSSCYRLTFNGKLLADYLTGQLFL